MANPEPRVEEQADLTKPEVDLAEPQVGLAEPQMGDEVDLAEPLMGEEVLAESLVDVLDPWVEVESTTPPSNNKWSEF